MARNLRIKTVYSDLKTTVRGFDVDITQEI